METMPKSRLGIHTATAAGMPKFKAETAMIFIEKMYINTNASPIATFIPIPPRRLWDETENPIRVRMYVAKG
jgi:hypothetical protein